MPFVNQLVLFLLLTKKSMGKHLGSFKDLLTRKSQLGRPIEVADYTNCLVRLTGKTKKLAVFLKMLKRICGKESNN